MSIAHSTERLAPSFSGSAAAKTHRATAEFSIAETRYLVRDLFEAKPAIYWTDFLLSMGIGAFCFTALLRGLFVPRLAGWLGIESAAFYYGCSAALFVIMCLAFYRATLFTHELVHLRDNAVPGFRTAWNLLCGVPFLMPSFLYQTHVHHHMRKHYATKEDGEYLALGSSVWAIIGYLAQSFVIPVVAAIRFLILTPAKMLHPSVARWVNARASAMVVDPAYVRPLPTDKELRVWRRQELFCFVFCATMATLLITGVLPIKWLILAYSTAVSVITLNAIRTLGAHRYVFNREHEVTFVEQLLDSVNYPNHPFISALWAPVGLRFHALHHLFPSMPYHSLAKAHRRLMEQLPADSPYRQTVSPGLWASLRQLWRTARQAQAERRRAAQ
jgi:fatty acid desaturase